MFPTIYVFHAHKPSLKPAVRREQSTTPLRRAATIKRRAVAHNTLFMTIGQPHRSGTEPPREGVIVGRVCSVEPLEAKNPRDGLG